MKNKKKYKTIFLTVLTLLVFIIVGTAGYFYYCVSKLNSNSAQSSNVPIIKPESNSNVNILIMGVDIGTVGNTTSNNPTRTDTMILFNYNPTEKKAAFVSIPRDTLVRFNNKNHKINEVHAIGGVNDSIKAVENLLGVDVNYYGQLNYAGFRKVIDAIGGIDMPIEQNMDYDDGTQNLHIHFKKGETVHLDGEKAEEFFRWRKNNNGTGLATGDLGRIDNQHIFMQKVFEKIKSPSTIIKIPSILSTITNNAETNIDGDSLLKYGYDFSQISKDNITTTTLAGEAKYIRGVSYFIYDKNKNAQLINQLKGTSAAQ